MDPNQVNTAIRVEHVSKDFVLPHEKAATLKSLFVKALRPRSNGSTVQHALKDISFDIPQGEFFGIVGRNGSGKSTLLKMLAGIYQPTAGRIQTQGQLVPFIELGVGFSSELSGRDNIFLNGAMLGFTPKQIKAMYPDIVKFAELEDFMDQKLKNYSSGMQVRLAFSMATRAKADILLVDEVLAVGDADFQHKCFDYFKGLKRDKKTVVFVSHDMNAVREYCDRAILIDRGKIIFEGIAEDAAKQYTRLFNRPSDKAVELDTPSDRWGVGGAEITAIAAPAALTQADDHLDIKVTIKQTKALDSELLLGIAIKNKEGHPVCGTNSQIIRRSVPQLGKGGKMSAVWRIPNIFNEGDYSIEPTVARADNGEVLQCWENAAAVTAINEHRTPYVVAPKITLHLE